MASYDISIFYCPLTLLHYSKFLVKKPPMVFHIN